MTAKLALTTLLLAGLAVLYPAGAVPVASGIEDLVGRLTPQALRNERTVEAALGIHLVEARGTQAFSIWTARAAPVRDVATGNLEYRMPRPGGPATAGTLLIIDIDPGACLLVADMQATYPDLVWDGAPSPHARDPDVYWTRRSASAALSLGFQADGPRFLRRLVYALDHPPEAPLPAQSSGGTP